MDHVPPQQFYAKEIRRSANLNLWKVPTHKRCNAAYREDEEYFYHALWPVVQDNNPKMGQVMHRDTARRIHNPQTPALLRSLLKTYTPITDGGIHLPHGVVQFKVSEIRLQRVVIKIAQGLFYLDHDRYIPRGNCKDIRMCLNISEVPEMYQLSWRGVSAKAVLPEAFSYQHFKVETLHLFSLLFWEAFLFCMAFREAH